MSGAPFGGVRGEYVALRTGAGLVRREVSRLDEVAIEWAGGETRGTVRALPFDDFSNG